MSASRFIEPVDVLVLRGNKLFGDPGSFGESLIPPWPSVAAGAIRSKILADDGTDLAGFAAGEETHPTLGSPDQPGAFRLRAFDLAREGEQGIEALRPLPADLVASRDGELRLRRLQPTGPAPGLAGSYPLERWPVLASDSRAKPVGGLWLDETGWAQYLAGDTPAPDTCIASEDLWRIDLRVGVGLDPATRRAADGQLFSLQAVALQPGVGFLAVVDGAEPGTRGLLRLGGDGRGATLRAVDYHPPEADLDAIATAGRCRIVLTTPGLFPEGWRLPGMDGDGRFRLGGVRGRVVSACVSRAETVSGWDLAARRPKPARRAAPTGSVYWLEDLEATPEALHRLVDHGLWAENDYDRQRQAEGFNRFTPATY